MTQISPVALLQNLLRCPSVTPHEGGALTLLENMLAAAGFAVERPVFSAPGTPDIDNLYARYGTGAPHLLFAGHTDVVPPGDETRWSHPPFSGSLVDGVIYGRGAVDMKGGIAAMVAAALRFISAHPGFPGSIGFLITGDEEGPAINGTVKLLDWAKARGELFDHCILGEPTNPEQLGDMIKIGRRGSLTGRLVVHGKQGHVGYPHLADNPIPGMVKLIGSLLADRLDRGTAHFDPSNIEVTSVDVGNLASNVIPAEARAVFNVRFNDIWSPQTLGEEVRRRLDTAAGNSIRYTLELDETNAVAFLTQPGPFTDLVSRAVEAETGLTPKLSTTGGTSDARFIKDYCPVVEFGLVGQTMHQIDERVAVADVERLTSIYERLIGDYFTATAA